MNNTMNKPPLRYSKQRELIYDYLLKSKAHPSAEMIYKDLSKNHPNLSLGTVYRNLNLLLTLGKIQLISTVNNVERYDARCDTHAHFICNKCNAVIDIQNMDTEAVLNACCLEKDNNVTSINLVFSGICKNCLNKSST
ncbi:MAG: transcriptional repressor [Succinivibrionaceae bacterium]